AAVAALALGFSRTFWNEAATSLEVYALHLVFAPLILILFLRALEKPENPGARALFAYVLGLSFSNHLMTVLLAPALAAGLWFRFGRRVPLRALLAATPAFLLGLSPYLYLPVQAAIRPAMNWGDPVTLQAFWRHVTGAQFRDAMLATGSGAWNRLAAFWSELPELWGYAPLAFAAAGLWSLRRHPGLLAFTLLLFVTCLGYATLYDIPDFRVYF